MMQDKLLAALVALGSTWPSFALADDIATEIVDALNKVSGVHPGFRANHAKGVVVEGSFKGAPEGAALSKAIIFNGSAFPVTVRFSDSTGIPNIPDGSLDASLGSASNVRCFCFCSAVGGVGKPQACPCRPQVCRRADLSGFLKAHGSAIAAVAAEAARTMEDSVGSVVVLANLDPRFDEVRA